MSDNNTESIKLSSGAIKSLESENVEKGAKKTIEVDFTFQIEKATQNNGPVYNCTLLDNDTKYGGFLLNYQQKDGIPGKGDIIHVSKILIALLPGRNSHIYFCKNVSLIKRGKQLKVDPDKLSNLSKKKSLENYKNSVYKAEEDTHNENIHSNSNKIFDD